MVRCSWLVSVQGLFTSVQSSVQSADTGWAKADTAQPPHRVNLHNIPNQLASSLLICLCLQKENTQSPLQTILGFTEQKGPRGTARSWPRAARPGWHLHKGSAPAKWELLLACFKVKDQSGLRLAGEFALVHW